MFFMEVSNALQQGLLLKDKKKLEQQIVDCLHKEVIQLHNVLNEKEVMDFVVKRTDKEADRSNHTDFGATILYISWLFCIV